jgi:hypothetical protein
MPAKQINFRYNIEPSKGVELEYEITEDGWLTEGFMHFPDGCNALVHVRVRLGISGTIVQVTPIENDYIALNDANFPFLIDYQVHKKDKILVEIINYDSVNPHQISVIITWASERTLR